MVSEYRKKKNMGDILMKNSNKAVVHNVPDYATVKEIVVKGAEKGGDKRQYMFLDKNNE